MNNEIELYERQLNFVESMVEFHPESLGIFSAQEKELFERYFLPDWSKVDDFKEYYRQLISEDPSLPEKAATLMARFIKAHKVQNAESLLP